MDILNRQFQRLHDENDYRTGGKKFPIDGYTSFKDLLLKNVKLLLDNLIVLELTIS